MVDQFGRRHFPDGAPFDAQVETHQTSFVLQNRWEIVGHLGQGGMGTVYVARDLRLAKRYCVVKKLRDDFFRAEDKEKAVAFFQREAVMLSRLQHPNIVHILDCFEENSEYYLVMEYVDGENLHQMLLKRGTPFPEAQVLIWASQISEVLHYLHSHDPPVIYRDLKPSNIMIDKKDRVKLVDFGIARPYVEDSDNTHVVSAGYSPPEQYWGAADPRSDIYALGATMYFLLTGQEPLALKTCSPKDSNQTVSSFTNQLVERATAQDLSLRYQSAPDMKEDLEHRFHEEPVVKKTGKWLVPAICVVAIALSCLGLLFLLKLTGVQNETAKSAPSKQTAQLKNVLSNNTQIFDKHAKKQPQSTDSYGDKNELSNEIRELSTPPDDLNGQKTDLAFKEEDEAQLTDPEGLLPKEETNRSSSLFFGNEVTNENSSDSN